MVLSAVAREIRPVDDADIIDEWGIVPPPPIKLIRHKYTYESRAAFEEEFFKIKAIKEKWPSATK